jgi:hypothetical protein
MTDILPALAPAVKSGAAAFAQICRASDRKHYDLGP